MTVLENFSSTAILKRICTFSCLHREATGRRRCAWCVQCSCGARNSQWSYLTWPRARPQSSALAPKHILMGPGGDLGPIDPQMIFPGEDGRRTAASAKEIVAAIGEAEERIRANPGSFPLFASLLSDVNMLMVEQAKAALSRSEALMREALSVSGRTREEVDALAAKLKEPLIDAPPAIPL